MAEITARQQFRAIEQEAEQFGQCGAKPSRRWVTTEVDLQAYIALWVARKPGERVNDVIRRLAGLGKRQR